jgi:flagellar protein FlgJ
MADYLSTPKLPVNLSDIAADAKERVQRILNTKKNRHAEKGTDAELNDACRQMESLFIHHLFKEMRATIPKSGFISGGNAEEIYTSMLDAEMAAKISTRGGIGLAEMLLHQLGSRSSQVEEGKSDEGE